MIFTKFSLFSSVKPKRFTFSQQDEYAFLRVRKYWNAQMEPIKRAGVILGEKINNLGTHLEHLQ